MADPVGDPPAAQVARHEDSYVPESADERMDWPAWRREVRNFVLTSRRFKQAIVAVVLLNCITLAIEDPTDTDERKATTKMIAVCDVLFTIIYAGEMVVKMVGLGFFLPDENGVPGTGGYFRDPWNRLDFVIVVTGLLSLLQPVLPTGTDSKFSALRAFRLLRPLRAVSRLSSIRLLVNSLLASLPKLWNVFLLFVFVLLVFGIISVQLWKGILRRRCVHNEAVAVAASRDMEVVDLWREVAVNESKGLLPGGYTDALFPPDLLDTVCKDFPESGRTYHGGFFCPWNHTCVTLVNPYHGQESFDNIGYAALSLFAAVTLEGWTALQYHVMDGTTYWSCIFFTTLIIICAFFIVNLTLVIINYTFESEHRREWIEYNANKIQIQGAAESQNIWERTLRKLLPKRSIALNDQVEAYIDDGWVPCVVLRVNDDETFDIRTNDNVVIECAPFTHVRALPEGGVQRRLWKVCQNRHFRNLILGGILINTFALAADHHGQPVGLERALNIINIVLTSLFAAEMVLKMAGYGMASYFLDGWNCFDFVVVVISVVDLSLGTKGNFSVLRSLRILRVLKLANRFTSLQRWILVIVRSLRAAAMLSALILLLAFVYALLGMQLMGGKFHGLDGECNYIERVNATLSKNGECNPRANFDHIGSALLTMFQILTGEDWNAIMYNGMASRGKAVSLFFVSFYFVGNYLMLNLFVAILLNQSSQAPVPERDTPPEVELVEMDQRAVPLLPTRPVQGDLGDNIGLLPSFSVGPEKSLCLFSPMSPLRRVLIPSVDSTFFEAVVLFFIVGSTVALAFEDPYSPPDSPKVRVLLILDYLFTSIFTFEALLKIIAFGFVMHPTSYLRRDGWNILDFLIVFVALVSYISARELTIFRVFRALRPLRFINKSKGLKIVIISLLRSLPAMANVFVISLLLWIIWSIMGVQLFKGTFYQCTESSYGDVTASLGIRTRVECENHTNYRWANYHSHFDHVGAACLALFEIASLEGWVQVMYLGMDGVSHDEAPVKNYRPAMCLFFLSFVVMGSFFVVNLFVSILLDTYYLEKRKRGNNHILLTESQKRWVDSFRAMLRGAHRPPEFLYEQQGNPVVDLAKRIVGNRWFDPAVQVCIMTSVLVLALEYYNEPAWWEEMQDAANITFTAIFTVEAVLKIVAKGPRSYFSNAWDRFDFLVVLVSWVGAIVALFGRRLGTVVTVFRILRLLRLLRMVKRAKGINVLLKTLLLSLPSMVNVSGILLLIFFIFAVLGVKLFGKVTTGEALSNYANFKHFFNALLTLIRISTGEAWESIMADFRREPPDCDQHLAECVPQASAIAYFVLFSLMGTYVLLNLFVAVILDSFDEVVKEIRSGNIMEAHMKTFNTAWARYDPKRTFQIDAAYLTSLLKAVGPPLGVPSMMPAKDVQAFVRSLNLSAVDGRVDLQPLLQALFCQLQGTPDEVDLPDDLANVVAKKADKVFLAKERQAMMQGAKVISAHHTLALIRAQARIRGMLARRQMAEYRRTGRYPTCVGLPHHMLREEHKEQSPLGRALKVIRRMSVNPAGRRKSRAASPSPSHTQLERSAVHRGRGDDHHPVVPPPHSVSLQSTPRRPPLSQRDATSATSATSVTSALTNEGEVPPRPHLTSPLRLEPLEGIPRVESRVTPPVALKRGPVSIGSMSSSPSKADLALLDQDSLALLEVLSSGGSFAPSNGRGRPREHLRRHTPLTPTF